MRRLVDPSTIRRPVVDRMVEYANLNQNRPVRESFRDIEPDATEPETFVAWMIVSQEQDPSMPNARAAINQVVGREAAGDLIMRLPTWAHNGTPYEEWLAQHRELAALGNEILSMIDEQESLTGIEGAVRVVNGEPTEWVPIS